MSDVPSDAAELAKRLRDNLPAGGCGCGGCDAIRLAANKLETHARELAAKDDRIRTLEAQIRILASAWGER